MQKRKLSIAIPASFISDIPHLREKTSKIGSVGRGAAIFRVSEIIIFKDRSSSKIADTNLTALLLSYMETPQYLRRRLFKIRPELQYAGILPPLRTPHHPLQRKVKNLKIGEYREGVVLSTTKTGTLVDIGVEQPAMLPNKKLPANQRVTIEIVAIDDDQATIQLVDPNEIGEYWGFSVNSTEHTFPELVKEKNFDLVIATSRLGNLFSEIDARVREKWQNAGRVLVAFGSPSQGLHEIARKEGCLLDDIVDFVVNTIPDQGTQTVRTEEALIASLAVFRATFDN